MSLRHFIVAILATASAVAAVVPVHAEETYVVGVSAGLTGYAAPIDRGWADGVRLSAEMINNEGGILGKRIKVVVEDNQSQPQQAVTSYNKMLSADGAQIFLGGALSAGNFAAAPIVTRKQIPMMTASILPKEENLVHWMFSVSPQPAFDVGVRLDYIAKRTNLRKIGIVYDESPFSNIQANVAKTIAPNLGLEIVGVEQFRNDDADVSVQIKKLASEGATALLRMGTGPGTLTVARNIKTLGLDDLLLLTTEQDVSEFRGIAKILGKNFFFSADLPQVVDLLDDSNPAKKLIEKFFVVWRKQYGDRDPTYGARAYDALTAVAEAARIGGSLDGPVMRDSLEKIHAMQGTNGVYNFDKNHVGLTENPMVLAQIIDAKLVLAK